MYKSIILSAACMMLTSSAFSQSKDETKYRRSSLYTLMIPGKGIDAGNMEIVKKMFTDMKMADKYNDHNLTNRILDKNKFEAIAVTPEEVKAAEGSTGSSSMLKKGLSFAKKSVAAEASNTTGVDMNMGMSDAEYIARFNKYFKENHTANKLIAKWLGGGEDANGNTTTQLTLVDERGIQTLSQDELNNAKNIAGGMDMLRAKAFEDLVPKTFVMVSRYSYLSAEDIINVIAGATGMASSPLAGAALSQLSKVLKGYFVKTTTYLYQIDLTEQDIEKMYQKYGKDFKGLYTDEDFNKMKFVGKTWDYAPATMQLNLKGPDDSKLIARATERATDGAISKLQKKYDQFKTLSTLHKDGDNLYAYVGMKEGVKEGDTFEVLQKKFDAKTGKEVYDVVGKVKVEKGKLWDNRAGAGEKLNGEASSKDDSKGDASLQYTSLGQGKKFFGGELLRAK